MPDTERCKACGRTMPLLALTLMPRGYYVCLDPHACIAHIMKKEPIYAQA